jgi:hypothetical protein
MPAEKYAGLSEELERMRRAQVSLAMNRPTRIAH